MNRMVIVLGALAVAAPLAAQQQQAKDKDPTKDVAAAPLPAGWSMRLDPKDATKTAKFVTMGSGYHVTSGGAAIYYNPKDVVTGDYTVSATFAQSKPSGHEGYGIFVGGSKLQDESQSYVYFLVRPSDGKFLINHRAGNDVHKVVDWTANPGLVQQDSTGKATNTLAIRVVKDSVHFIANGKEVKAFSKADMHGFDVGGQAGLRINHNLDVHIASFTVTPGAK